MSIPRSEPERYEEQKHCCTSCAMKRLCHVCHEMTTLACSDCAIDLGVTVYVCKRKECRDYHESKCGHSLKARIEALQGENEQWKTWGIIEIAVRNQSVSEYMQHWEERATKAEAKLSQIEADHAEQIKALTALHERIVSRMTQPVTDEELLLAFSECPESGEHLSQRVNRIIATRARSAPPDTRPMEEKS
jgi:hypothetical protein